MGYIVGVVNQKGGAGKSTISRLLATEFARMDGGTWDVKIADLDVSQGTSFQWMRARAKSKATPEIRVEVYSRADKALQDAEDFDVLILDGAPHATAETLKVAKAAHVVIVPTGCANDDLHPSVLLAHELVKNGVDKSRLLMVLTRTSDSEAEANEARAYIRDAGHQVASGSMPERTAFRRASDLGYSAAETAFPTLNDRCRKLFDELAAPLQQTQPNAEKAA